jgi:hypothetical protein
MRGFYPQTRHETLIAAVVAGSEDRVRAALNEGANPNRPDTLGDTAVLWAAALGEVTLLRLLLAHGGDLSGINAQGDTIWHAAAREGHRAVFDAWPVPAEVRDRPNKKGETLWALALGPKNPPDVAQALAAQTAVDPETLTPLIAAQRLHQALPRPAHVAAVLAGGGAVGWDTQVGTLGSPWDRVLLQYPENATKWRPEGAPVLTFRRRRHP